MKVYDQFLKAMAATTTVVVATCTQGFVLSSLWGWFMVPKFGTPPLGFVPACGIVLIISLILPQHLKAPPTLEEQVRSGLKDHLVYIFVFPLILLFVGWILHLFM